MPWTHRDNARANIYPAVVYLNTPYGSLDLCQKHTSKSKGNLNHRDLGEQIAGA